MLVDHRKKVERQALAYSQRRILPQAFGDFLVGLAEWDWFLTLTFRQPSTPAHSVSRIADWFGDVERQASLLVGRMVAEEFGSFGGRFHCHGLVAGPKALDRTFSWREAFRRV